MASHHLGLATDDEQDATVAEDKNHDNDHVEAHEIPDPERHPSPLVPEVNRKVAVAIHSVAGIDHHPCRSASTTDP